MQYKYAKENLDYTDFASGRVLYSLPGHPAFPVRLASEIFQRCVAIRETTNKNTTPCVMYDPCCGAAYHLSVLAHMHREQIREVIASDVDKKAIEFANRNLDLLSSTGIDKRIDEISKMIELYNKDAHKDALQSAYILKNRVSASETEHPLVTRAFQANVTDRKLILKNIKPKYVDIVFADVPYGQHSLWQASDFNASLNPLWSMLDTLIGVLSPSSVVALVSDKRQKISHESYQRSEQFQIGKRRVVILKPV